MSEAAKRSIYEGEIYAPCLGGPDDAAVAAAEAVISARKAAIKEQEERTLLRCGSFFTSPSNSGCKGLFAVKDCEYVQTYWYTDPHGCSGGDYWSPGEGQWICPGCGTRNRLLNGGTISSNEGIAAMRGRFKCVREEKVR